MIESEKSWKNVSICELRDKIQVHGMIETLGKSKATQIIFCKEYKHVTLHECKISSSILKKL